MLWPVGMIITIVATANHFIADAVVGAMIPFVSWKINHIWLLFEPAQRWVFGPISRRMDAADVYRREEKAC